jgi:hypothetical protein
MSTSITNKTLRERLYRTTQHDTPVPNLFSYQQQQQPKQASSSTKHNTPLSFYYLENEELRQNYDENIGSTGYVLKYKINESLSHPFLEFGYTLPPITIPDENDDIQCKNQ